MTLFELLFQILGQKSEKNKSIVQMTGLTKCYCAMLWVKGGKIWRAQVPQIWLVIIAAVEFGIMIGLTKFCVVLNGNYPGALNEWTHSTPSNIVLILLSSMLVNRMGSVCLRE